MVKGRDCAVVKGGSGERQHWMPRDDEKYGLGG